VTGRPRWDAVSTEEEALGAKKDGTLSAFDAEAWGTGGNGGYNPPPLPYVFTKIPNTKLVGKGIRTNRGGQQAWRAIRSSIHRP